MTRLAATAHDPWGEALRKLGPAGKLRSAERLYFTARRLKEAALRAKYPAWSDVEVKQALNQSFWNARD